MAQATLRAKKTAGRNGSPRIRQTKLLINNRWVEPAEGNYFETLNPATGKPIAKVAEGTAADIDKAVKAARAALENPAWKKMSPGDRGRLLYKLGRFDRRKSRRACHTGIAQLRQDHQRFARRHGRRRHLLPLLRRLGRQDRRPHVAGRRNFLSYTLRQPVGVVGQIIPWNFPLVMLAWKWGPALACGNTVVLKPAEQTPLTALRVGELAIEAGFPAGVINIVNGFGETAGAALVTHPDVDKIAFTGHVDTAKIIQKAAADTLKRCTFELGGKSPNVIFADADMDEAVAGAFHAIYFHGGQCCTAGSRLFVEKKIQREFVERLAEKAKRRRLGDPLDPKTEQGPQVSQEQLDKILGYVELGQKQGAKLVTGGERHGEKGFFVEPTIFDNVKDDMAIAKDEIFGPVVSVLPFKNVDEVIDRANSTYYGLAAAVWTKDIDKAHLFAAEVKAGTVWVNCYHVVDTTTPFGGFKKSGKGRENGEAALEHYTETKTVTIKLHE